MNTPKINSILKDSKHNITLFNNAKIQALEDRIEEKDGKLYVECIIRKKRIILKPEEVVRQLYAHVLIDEFGYEDKLIKFEYSIHFGREKKKADIAVFDPRHTTKIYIIAEIKKPKEIEGKLQLKSYTNATGAPIAVWTNGGTLITYNRKDPNYFEPITKIPLASQTLDEVLKERYTLKSLIINDKLFKDKLTLKKIILNMEDEVLANAGVDVFEEVFKLIFAKLFDELKSRDNKIIIDHHLNKEMPGGDHSDFDKIKSALASLNDDEFRLMEFRNRGGSENELKTKIQKLFDEAKEKWKGVFANDSKIELSASHLAICVSSLHDVKLFNSNLQVIDEAFEYLVNKSSKGEKGQYFTPRHIIDMCVKMLNPKRGETMIDSAAGSCGFPVHTIFKITGKLFTTSHISKEDKNDILKVFGIDFDEKVVRVARTLNLIAGDGETNVLYLNTLDWENWKERTEDVQWSKAYGNGYDRLKKLKAKNNSNEKFNFDLLMANPPFAGDIKERALLSKYELAFTDKGKQKPKVGRDILFIERNLSFLKPGGRMAIVLPQGRFNNTSDKNIREFIADKCRILAVVGLHQNTFKPHTGTKTSVLFVQKWNDDEAAGPLCPKLEDYPIFFAVSEKGGKDNSGEYVYASNGNGNKRLDKYGHQIVDHDLHNHGGALPDGIAEAFVEFAKDQEFSFAPEV